MNIVILGAGAIGSLFGGLLSKHNNVILVGRPSHVHAIQQKGLKITGKTRLKTPVSALENLKHLPWSPDLLILTVKSYDTEAAMTHVRSFISKNTIVLSLQNGLNNIECIEQFVDKTQIVAGVTTQGAIFTEPGIIHHTGKGITILGELNGSLTKRLKTLVQCFNEAGIETITSQNIHQELWTKAIINSSINPLTAFFHCKNGYLLKNPLLVKIVEYVCKESTMVASAMGIPLTYAEMIKKTKQVIQDTSENYSSMLQSILHKKPTEIDAINGVVVKLGKQHGLQVPFNDMLIRLIRSEAQFK